MTEKYFSVNEEACSIRCKLYQREHDEPRQIVLFGHGFGGHKDNRAAARFARRILEKNKGVAIVTFDWPCHGEDARKLLRLEDCDKYLRLLLDWLRERYNEPELFAYATSFGAYLFLKYLSEHGNPFVRLALRCPAVPMYDVLTAAIMTGQDWDKLRKGKPVQVGFDRKVEIDGTFLDCLKAADLTGRDFLPYADELLILHGTKDEVVPLPAVRAFAEENVIEFEAIEGADHRFQDPGKMDYAISRIAAFFGMR